MFNKNKKVKTFKELMEGLGFYEIKKESLIGYSSLMEPIQVLYDLGGNEYVFKDGYFATFPYISEREAK